MTKVVELMHHIVRSSAMRPIWTFWLVACGVIPAATAGWLTNGGAVTILTVVAAVLVFAASHRDDRLAAENLLANVEHLTDVVDVQREGLEARIRVLIRALREAGVPVPREKP